MFSSKSALVKDISRIGDGIDKLKHPSTVGPERSAVLLRKGLGLMLDGEPRVGIIKAKDPVNKLRSENLLSIVLCL